MTPFWRFQVFLAWKPTNETYPWKGHFLSPMRKKLYHNWNYLFCKIFFYWIGVKHENAISNYPTLYTSSWSSTVSVKQHPGKEFFQSEIFWFLDILSVIFSLDSWIDGLPGWCRAEQVNDRVAVHHHCGPGHEEGGLPLTVKRYSSPHLTCCVSCTSPLPAYGPRLVHHLDSAWKSVCKNSTFISGFCVIKFIDSIDLSVSLAPTCQPNPTEVRVLLNLILSKLKPNPSPTDNSNQLYWWLTVGIWNLVCDPNINQLE